MYDVFVYPYSSSDTQNGYLIEHDQLPLSSDSSASQGERSPALVSLSAYLKRFILRSKVQVRDVGAEWDTWAAWTDRDNIDPTLFSPLDWKWGRSGAVEPVWPNLDIQRLQIVSNMLPNNAKRLFDHRAPGLGERLLLLKGDKRTHHSIDLRLLPWVP
jgi:transferase CAF17, mitochondrial